MNTALYKQQTTLSLYASPSQSQQGVSSVDTKKILPVELSECHIKMKLLEVGNEHAENEKFICNCSKFAKFLFEKQCRDFDKEPYQRLDSKILKNKLGKNPDRVPNYYVYVIESLRSIGLVEVNERYEFTKDGTGKCKGYRINLQLPDQYEVSSSEDLFYSENSRIDDPNYLLDLMRVKMNEKMFVFIANFLPHDEKQRAFYIYYNWITNNQFIRIDRYGRKHSLLTIMDKRLRCCFTVDNQRVIKEWDIHACMPFLFLNIVLDYVNYRKANKLTLVELAETNQEICKYISWIKSGRFYIELYKAFENLKGEPKSAERIKDLKKSFFRNILFSETPAIDKELRIQKVFAELFPFINQCLVKYKRKYGYKAVAQSLQLYESELMNLTTERLKNNNPKCFYLRFHDAILTDDVDTVRFESIMNDTINKLYSIQGRVKFNQHWGANFDTIVRSLGLHVYSSYLNYKKDKYLGRLKSSHIGKAVSSVSKEYKHITAKQASREYDENIYNINRSNKATSNFMLPKLYLPSHWNTNTVEAFKTFAIKTINEVFDEKECHFSGSQLNIIRKNREMVLKIIKA